MIWTLFGDECDYYKSLFEICKTLDFQVVHIIRDSFTADVCRHITWAIICNGRFFFNTVLVEAQLWPMSLIQNIIDDVRYANVIVRPFYPIEWLIMSGLSGKGTGSGNISDSGGTRGGVMGKAGKHREQGWDNNPQGRDGTSGVSSR
jgi:hypothetical protein